MRFVTDEQAGESAGFRLQGRYTRYDCILTIIPVTFLVAVFLGELTSVSLRIGLAGASAVGAVVMIDALFLNPPSPSKPNG